MSSSYGGKLQLYKIVYNDKYVCVSHGIDWCLDILKFIFQYSTLSQMLLNYAYLLIIWMYLYFIIYEFAYDWRIVLLLLYFGSCFI
jgi:hypothetical protein